MEGGGWREEGGGWRVEGGGWRISQVERGVRMVREIPAPAGKVLRSDVHHLDPPPPSLFLESKKCTHDCSSSSSLLSLQVLEGL